MLTSGKVLVLEDDPEDLRQILRVIREAGFEPVACRSAREALEHLEAGLRYLPVDVPTLAVIDRDLRLAPDRSAGSATVLDKLARQVPSCVTIVYSANLATPSELARLSMVHPRALPQPKEAGREALVKKINALMQRHVGDLEILDGRVRHRRSRRVFKHRVAAQLLMAYPRSLPLNDSEARAARRLQRFLAEVDAACQVVPRGERRYALELSRDR